MAGFSIEKFCQVAVKQGAADIHLNVGAKPMIRLGGRLQPLETQVLMLLLPEVFRLPYCLFRRSRLHFGLVAILNPGKLNH